MSNQPNLAAPNPPSGKSLNVRWAAVGSIVIIITIFGLKIILPPAWRPQLNVTNTGTNAVTLSYKAHTSVTAPRKTWSMRFSGGDTITIRAGDSPDAPSRTVSLPARNPKPWSFNPTAQRWTADVNADDPKNIRLDNCRFEEITSPPSKSEPWP